MPLRSAQVQLFNRLKPPTVTSGNKPELRRFRYAASTVTIKDIASKTELDKLDDRAVKYDLDPATNAADKSKVTYRRPYV